MSHKLQVGEMKAAYLTDKEIWAHFNFIYSPKSKNSTTYKFVLIKSILENLYKINVMGAIYGDTGCTIYDFDNGKEQLKLNSTFYSFMQRFQRVLNYLTNYHLALFLEKFNEKGDTTNLLLKVENVSKRSSLDQFYQVLSSFYNGKCFYCGKTIKKENAHVDHFIPWSFVQADQLWNLVIACSTCNLSKSDKLANEPFLETMIDRNESLISITALRIREDMQVYSSKKLKDLYHFSVENGFTDFWVPKKMIL
ncbi:HNH endonuclease [Neobacillus jeddahensis]|uniref:HNH endonuclease n=1 Tax=Neobacillus jeddahensis TaxID=1461580 RepID=UPI00058E8E3E|nr:HNH endonuclease domain-containing protein [Neobacillus jeddahensis]